MDTVLNRELWFVEVLHGDTSERPSNTRHGRVLCVFVIFARQEDSPVYDGDREI